MGNHEVSNNGNITIGFCMLYNLFLRNLFYLDIFLFLDHQYIKAKIISPKIPQQHGLYWGYKIRLADSISKVFTECSYPVRKETRFLTLNNFL